MHYTPEEHVRLEVLAYPNPEGIHPIEEAWRDLARKLKKHVEELTKQYESHHGSRGWGQDIGHAAGKDTCQTCSRDGYQPHNFPKAFNPNAPTSKTS